MRYFAAILFVIILFSAEGNAQATSSRIEDLAWLAGCWESNIPEKNLLISEQWMKPAGGIMIGSGRTVRNGKAVDFEFMRIAEEPDGIYFIAKPRANKDETRFKLIRSPAAEVVFENPQHDFPQRVIYKREGEKMNGRIEGNRNGKLSGIDFPMARVRCE